MGDVPRDNNDRPAGRRRWLTVLYVVAVAAAVWAALLLHERGDETPEPLFDDGRYVAGTQPSARPSDLLGTLNMRAMDELPADLAMPDGAVRRSLIRRIVFGSEQIKAEYAVRGALDSTVEAVVASHRSLGWRALPGVASAGQVGPGVWRNFRKSADTLTIHLNSDGDWVMITAVVSKGRS